MHSAPVLIPRPNDLQYRRGVFRLRPADGIALDPRVVEAVPKARSDAERILGARFPEEAHQASGFVVLFGEDAELGDEGYSIDCSESGLTVHVRAAAGWIYALQTLRQLIVARDEGVVGVKAVQIADSPAFPVRGVHLYLPAREDIDEFKGFVDALSTLKYNRIYLETAGMEMKRHPELNEAWERFAADMLEYPGKAKLYQNSFKYQKNSIHVECCGGGTLSQDDVRDLVEYCKARCFTVVPEVQSLSHCHFLTLAHREIAERPEDPYPDTYCPSNEASYALLFDVIDEIVEVFRPEIVHIGHDEVYTIAHCDKCRRRNAAQLFASDVNRIHAYLQALGVQTEMWAEKFLDAYNGSGSGEGGAFKLIDSYETSKIFEAREATFAALDMVSDDIVMMNWYWHVAPTGFARFADHGFDALYGNFFGANVVGFDRHSRTGPALGGVCSHWSWVRQENMARDGFLFNLLFSSDPLWHEGFGDDDYESVRDLALAYSPYFFQDYNRTELLSVTARAVETVPVSVRREDDEAYYSKTSFVQVQNFRHTSTEHEVGTWSSRVTVRNVAQTVRVAEVGDSADSLVFTHATDADLPHRPSDHGYLLEDYLVGRYVVTYADGTHVDVPIHYGAQIGNLGAAWGRTRETADWFATDVRLQQVAHAAQPCLVASSSQGAVTMYRYEWRNPRPDTEIRELTFAANELDTPFSVYIADIHGLRWGEGSIS